MTYRVRLHWEGKRWEFADVPVEIQEGGDLLAVPARYTPRRFTIRLPLGDLRDLIAAGALITTATCEVIFNQRLLISAPPVSIEAGHRGHLATVVCEERPIRDGNMVPPQFDMRVVALNPDETRRREELLDEYAALQWEWLRAPSYNKPVIGMTEVAQKLNDIGVDVAVPVWSATGLPATDYNANQIFADTTYDQVTIQTFDTDAYDERVEGLVYPLIFGRPGINGTPAARPIPVDDVNDTMLLAGHSMTTGNVTIYKRHQGTTVGHATGAVAVTNGEDDLGRSVALLEGLTGNDDDGGDPFYEPGGDYGVAFDVADPNSAEGLSSDAADVVSYMTAQVAGLRMNLSSTHLLRDYLRGWKLDGAVDSRADPWSILTRDILPLLPVAIVAGPSGVDYVPIRLDAGKGEDSRKIVAGSGFSPASTLYRRDGSRQTVSRVVVEHAFNVFSNKPARASQAWANSYEVARGGGLSTDRAETVSTPWIYDTATAQRSAQQRLLRESKNRIEIEYQANPYRYGIESAQPLEIGDVIELTDDAMRLTSRLALVTRKVRRNTSDLRFTLTLL